MKTPKKSPLSLILPVLGLTAATASAATLIDFEDYALASDLTANGWSLAGSDGSAITVITTSNSGSYVGGRAIQTDDGGATFAGLLVSQAGINGLQMDVNWDYTGAPASGLGTPTVQLSGWDDLDPAGTFASAERTAGLAMDNTEPDFEFMSSTGEIDGNNSTLFAEKTWYRLTMTWTNPDGTGNRDLTLRGYDLTNDSDLGIVNTVTMTAAEFGVDPSDWDGIGIRMTRGTMDNIVLIPEPGSALLGLFGGALLLLRRR
ncbi:MAG: hypothetical protein P8P32_06835 [Akkermansiaceae bacterium]|nr:hypothetical protein [Akkermansiaceae bacterium]